MTNAIAEYNKTQVLTASGPQVIVLLYDAALQALRLAQDGIRRNHHPDKARFLGRAFRIVGELDNVLDMERGGEIARALRRLYDYMLNELTQANLHHDAGRLEGPIRCLSTLREAWAQIAAQAPLPVAVGA